MNIEKKQVLDALAQGNFREALSLVQQLEQKNPENLEIKMLFAQVFQEMSNYTMAYEKYIDALKIDPSNSQAYIKLGLMGMQLEKWEQSLSHYKTALSLDPDNLEIVGYYGWALWTYGAMQEDWASMHEAYTYLHKAKRNGVELQVVNTALASYHIENATSSWPLVESQEGPLVCATTEEHIQEAKEELEKASTLIDPSNVGLKNRYNEVYTFVTGLEERKFRGYPFVRKAGIIGGVILLLFSPVWAFVVFIMVALYHHANLSPGYIDNRDYLKNNDKAPFWIRRLDAIERAADRYRSFRTSSNDNWIITLSSVVMQHMMVIFMLPFLIVSGYMKNYDLLNKVKQYTSN